MRKLRLYCVKQTKIRIKPQLSHSISQVLDIVWSLPNIYMIEQSHDYKLIHVFASCLMWVFFKLTWKTVFRVFHSKFQEDHSRVSDKLVNIQQKLFVERTRFFVVASTAGILMPKNLYFILY